MIRGGEREMGRGGDRAIDGSRFSFPLSPSPHLPLSLYGGIGVKSERQPILLDLAIQRSFADAEELGGLFAFSLRQFQRALDVIALDVVHRLADEVVGTVAFRATAPRLDRGG